jgi:cell division protein ZapE
MTPSEKYQADLADEVISFDANQQGVISAFDNLYALLQPESAESESLWQKAKALLPVNNGDFTSPKGIYLWGGVGRGKTYLMDLFSDCIPARMKKRTHFHRFMQSVHADLKRLQGEKNPLENIAAEIADTTKVLCFDEFFVLDIGDAMILAGLLEALFDEGVILIATSNIHPDALYDNGLQRERFLPAIELIKTNTNIIELDGAVDYRLRSLSQATLYHTPLNDSAEAALLKSFNELAPNRSEIESDGSISILDRDINTRYHAEDVVWFDFLSICDGPRSAFDYVEVAKMFHAVIISGVPRFDDSQNEKARRFVNLVDELYDRRVKLIVSADVGISDLYRAEGLALEFERTESRLLEMQSHDYLRSGHVA